MVSFMTPAAALPDEIHSTARSVPLWETRL